MARTKEKNSKTAAAILRSARALFLRHGFAGTSMSHIAQGANVPKSLIYHHFCGKEVLWKAVKGKAIENLTSQPLSTMELKAESLEALVTQIVTLRFNAYASNPDLVKIISWQRLEQRSQKLRGILADQLNTIAPQIVELQKKGKVRPDLNPEMVNYLVMSTASNAFMDQAEFLLRSDGKKQRERYLKLIINCLCQALKT